MAKNTQKTVFFFSFRPLIFASYNDMVSDLLNGGSSKKYARSLCGGFFVFADLEHDFRQKKESNSVGRRLRKRKAINKRQCCA